MEIILTQKESEDFFYNSICNALGYFENYGGTLNPSDEHYKEAKASLKNKGTAEACIEDIYMEVLRMGHPLVYVDGEDEGLNRTVFLKDVHERVAKTPTRHLLDLINENDDATTADVVIQTVLFQEIIFG